MPKPRVFVTRRIPDSGLNKILAATDAEIWPDQLPPPYDLIRKKIADCDGMVSLLTDKIDGMGRIGYAMAKRGYGGWGMRVLYFDEVPSPKAESDLAARRVDLDTLLKESDFISVHASLTESSRGLFGTKEFAKMKKTAVF